MKKLSSLILISAILFTAVTGCGKKEKIAVRKVTDSEIGKEAVCQVTKNKFKLARDTKAIDYKGETYYFCCPGCDTEFIKAPEKFISQTSAAGQQPSDTEILYWTCSMHPQVRSDKPGKCPICAMALIPIYKGEKDKIIVEEKTKTLVGIKSRPAIKKELVKIIRLPAKIASDNDLYIAQQEYISSFKNLQKIKDTADDWQKSSAEKTLESAKFRLSLLGYNEDEIKKLQQLAEPDKNLIYPGNKVWAYAQIYEYDLPAVKPGQNVTAVTPAYHSEKFSGRVRFIEPVLNPQTRSAKARIEFDNPEDKLKLEMYAYLEIELNMGKHLSVPRTSLIDTGTRKVVYLDLGGGRYKMREVKTGIEAEDYVQITDGLKENDLVVVSGNFMIDSQSTLTGGQSLLYGGAEEVKSEKGDVPKPKKAEHRH